MREKNEWIREWKWMRKRMNELENGNEWKKMNESKNGNEWERENQRMEMNERRK